MEEKHKKSKLIVEVLNKEEMTIYTWSIDKFLHRYYFIKQMLD